MKHNQEEYYIKNRPFLNKAPPIFLNCMYDKTYTIDSQNPNKTKGQRSADFN